MGICPTQKRSYKPEFKFLAKRNAVTVRGGSQARVASHHVATTRAGSRALPNQLYFICSRPAPPDHL